MRTDRLQTEQGVRFKWLGFPLHPETPDEGVDLAQYFSARGLDLKEVQERLTAVAAKEGLPFMSRTRSSNSRKAQELGKLAEHLGVLGLYMHNVYDGYFVQGINIGETEEIIKIADAAGIPAEEARKALEQKTFSDGVDNDWRTARKAGITGVPAFMYGGRVLVGFRPYEDLVHLLQQ